MQNIISLFLLLFIFMPLGAYEQVTAQINLTENEKQFIKNHPNIVLGTEKRWEPYVLISSDGEISGYDADVLKLINKVSGTNFTLKAGNWEDMQTQAQNREIDGLSTGGVHKERQMYLNFSDIYIKMQKMLIVSEKNPNNIHSTKNLKDKIIAIHKSNLVDEKIAKKFKEAKIIKFDTLEDVISSVVTGEADAMFGNGSTLYLANKMGMPYLKYAAKLPDSLKLAFGVRKDWSEAISIINKSLAYIGKHKLLELKDKWFFTNTSKINDYIKPDKKTLDTPLIADKTEKKQFYITLNYLFIILLINISIFITFRHYLLKKSHAQLQKVIEDEVTKTREKEKLLFHQNKLAAMGEMLENIAHQWRQPLSQINSSVLVIDDILDDNSFKNIKIEEKLLEIESLTKYLSNTIDDFKDFFAQDKQRKIFNLRNTVEKALHIVKGNLQKYRIDTILFIDENITYNSYENELQQVMVVILNNAKDAFIERNTFHPIIKISVEIENNFYLLTICDNAGGMTKAVKEKIFEPYFTTKHKSQGAGIGLYMSKKIIHDSLNGELSVINSELGACFKIKLEIDSE